MDFYFGMLRDEKELSLLKKFLLEHDMNYPNYETWVLRTCVSEINLGYKRAILAFARQNSWELVGNAIYQPSKELPETLHFKNMRVLEGFKRNGVASFLVRQVEQQAIKQGLGTVILDFRLERRDINLFFLAHGYKPLNIMPLYDDDNLDIVMAKNLEARAA
jgi:GNAT superfamily N-acetyltransferase